MRRMILAVALLAVPASAGGQSRAEDPCAAAQPDNRQKVDGRKSTSAHVSGLLTSVSGDGCDMLLTDVTVPAGYRVMLEGGVEGGTAPGHACEQWRLITRWFRKRGGTYEPIGGKSTIGTSGPRACIMEHHVQEADVTAQTTFRIAVASLWPDGPMRVRTSASVSPLATGSH